MNCIYSIYELAKQDCTVITDSDMLLELTKQKFHTFYLRLYAL